MGHTCSLLKRHFVSTERRTTADQKKLTLGVDVRPLGALRLAETPYNVEVEGAVGTKMQSSQQNNLEAVWRAES